MKTRYVLTITAIFLAIMFVVPGCGGGSSSTPVVSDTPADNNDDTGNGIVDDPSTPSSDEEKVTKLIKAESGGTVSLKNGISLYIPPNALNEDTEISLSSVDIAQFNGDAEIDGGVNDLHIIGAIFEPDGTVLNIPAVVRLPLPKEWVNDKNLDWYAGSGSDPLEALPTGEALTVVGTPGAYFAELELTHFSFGMVSYNCHAGTLLGMVKNFRARGCSDEQIIDMVESSYPGIKVDAITQDSNHTGSKEMQAFLDTYFDTLASYNADDPILDLTILKDYIKAGRQVVIAFSTADTWSQRKTDGNKFYEYFPHTTYLEIVNDGEGNEVVQMRHTVAHSAQKSDKDKEKLRYGGLLKYMGETLFYTYPLDKIDEYRTLPNGKAFKEYAKANYDDVLGGPEFDKFINSRNSHKSYKSVNIYIEKGDGSSNPCADNNFSYSYSDPSSPTAQEYLVSQTNIVIQRATNPDVVFWKPDTGAESDGSNPGVLIFHFHFDGNVKKAHLVAPIHTFHWWYSQGHGYLYGSKDGSNWERLSEVKPPAYGKSSGDSYNKLLPDTLTGTQDLWFKVELFSFGESAESGGVWTNTAQFSRHDIGTDAKRFKLDVMYD